MFQPGRAIKIGIHISLDETINYEVLEMLDHLSKAETQLSIVNKYILCTNVYVYIVKIMYFFYFLGV